MSERRTINTSEIEDRIVTTTYRVVGVTTICVLTLDNGFVGVGHSTPAYPESFDKKVGKDWAYKHAFTELLRGAAFMVREDNWREFIKPGGMIKKGSVTPANNAILNPPPSKVPTLKKKQK